VHEVGGLDEGFLATYGDRGRLVGAIAIGQGEELEARVKRLIEERAPVDSLERGLVTPR
jgi:hypothetical protein